MIASLRGTLESRGADYAVISVAGVGFKVNVPGPTLSALGQVGDNAFLYTMLYVRQEQLALYGFETSDELRTFELLLTVTGVGPKAALAILSSIQPDSLRAAVGSGRLEILNKIPGVGRKTVEHILLELKGKLGPVQQAVAGKVTEDGELVAALTGLGYTTAEAAEAVRAIPGEVADNVEERVLAALRYFASK